MKEYNFDMEFYGKYILQSKTNIKMKNENFCINSNIQRLGFLNNNFKTKQSINKIFNIQDIISIKVYPGELFLRFIFAWISCFVLLFVYTSRESSFSIEKILFFTNLISLGELFYWIISNISNYKVHLSINGEKTIKFPVFLGIGDTRLKKFLYDIKTLNPNIKINNYKFLYILVFFSIIIEIALVSFKIVQF